MKYKVNGTFGFFPTPFSMPDFFWSNTHTTYRHSSDKIEYYYNDGSKKKGVIKEVFEKNESYSVTVGLDSKETFGEFQLLTRSFFLATTNALD